MSAAYLQRVLCLVSGVCVLTWLCFLQLAYQRSMITKQERDRVFNVMRTLGLALWHEVCTLDVLMQVNFFFALVSTLVVSSALILF